MDYLKFVEHHRETDADITLGCLPCDDERAQDFGLMKINDEGDVIVSAGIGQLSLFSQSQRPAVAVEVRCVATLAWQLGGMKQRDVDMHLQDFAEKPKGDALKAMAVDTTILGRLAGTC
jgi:hypothetical protein